MTPPMGGMGGGWEMLRSMRHEGELSGRKIGRATASRVLDFARPYHRDIAVFLIAVVFDAGIGVANPVLAGRVINEINGNRTGAGTVVVRIALFIAALAVADAFLSLHRRGHHPRPAYPGV
jgi:ATP-binding cassette subfamily B protein